MIKKVFFSFTVSCFSGLVVYMLIEWIAGVLVGLEGFSTMTPEYLTLFPSEILAFGVAILSHGLIGAVFAAGTCIYEKAEIGFIWQNIMYFLVTGIVWIPVVCFVWQLYRYPSAFFCTVGGFALTYVVMSIVGYNITKKEVDAINAKLAENMRE